MSHNVTVTRTTTTVTTTSALLLNTGYLKTTSGILKILQLILGCVIVGLIGNYSDYHRANPHFYTPELFLLLIATTCLITTTCLLASCLLSISTATIIAKTMFELVYHGISFCLYLASSVYLLTQMSPYQNSRNSVISAMIAAGALGAINTGLYFASAFLAFRIYRRT